MKLITCSRQPGLNPWGALDDIVEQSSGWTPNPHLWHSLPEVFTHQQVSPIFPLAEGASSQKRFTLERAVCKEIANAQNSLSAGVLKPIYVGTNRAGPIHILHIDTCVCASTHIYMFKNKKRYRNVSRASLFCCNT